MRSSVRSLRILLPTPMKKWTVRTMRTAAEWITSTAVSVWLFFFSPYDLQSSIPRSSQAVRYNEIAGKIGNPGNGNLHPDHLAFHSPPSEPQSYPLWTIFLPSTPPICSCHSDGPRDADDPAWRFVSTDGL